MKWEETGYPDMGVWPFQVGPEMSLGFRSDLEWPDTP